MSLGNVTSSRVNDRYFQQAMDYLRGAAEMADYALPAHLEQSVHASLAALPSLTVIDILMNTVPCTQPLEVVATEFVVRRQADLAWI